MANRERNRHMKILWISVILGLITSFISNSFFLVKKLYNPLSSLLSVVDTEVIVEFKDILFAILKSIINTIGLHVSDSHLIFEITSLANTLAYIIIWIVIIYLVRYVIKIKK